MIIDWTRLGQIPTFPCLGGISVDENWDFILTKMSWKQTKDAFHRYFKKFVLSFYRYIQSYLDLYVIIPSICAGWVVFHSLPMWFFGEAKLRIPLGSTAYGGQVENWQTCLDLCSETEARFVTPRLMITWDDMDEILMVMDVWKSQDFFWTKIWLWGWLFLV